MKSRYNINTYIPTVYLDVTDGVTLAADDIHSRYNIHNIVVAPISLTWTQNSLTGEPSSSTIDEITGCNSISLRSFSNTESVPSIIFEILIRRIVVIVGHHLHSQ